MRAFLPAQCKLTRWNTPVIDLPPGLRGPAVETGQSFDSMYPFAAGGESITCRPRQRGPVPGGTVTGVPEWNAAAAGTAVVRAAGTASWPELRSGLARLLAQGNNQQELKELARLDQTASALLSSGSTSHEQMRLAGAWQVRLETFLGSLPIQEQAVALSSLESLLAGQLRSANQSISAGDAGVTAGTDVNIAADRGSVAGGVMRVEGGVHIAFPSASRQGRG